MAIPALTGSRVRDRRLVLGLRQSEVAEAAGISASYLNLIEHNRRRVGPDVLSRLATALRTEVGVLAEGAEGLLVADLREAAERPDGGAEVDRVEDFVGRFPGWAGLVAAQHRRIGRLERTVEALSDRMAHDPHLSATLHEVISVISAVRSTAAILADGDEVPPEWRARFHANLHDDAERLVIGAEALVAYLDATDRGDAGGSGTALDELDGWLEARDWSLPELDDAPEVLQAEVAGLATEAGRTLAGAWLARALRDAALLPLAALDLAVDEDGVDPVRLARRFGCGVLPVFRRLALLPRRGFGLVVCDASGAILFRRPVPDFPVPRYGSACALWPLFTALGRPMTPVEEVVEMRGRSVRRVRTLAFCEPHHPSGFGGPQVVEAAMLILPLDQAAGSARPVGASCRICPVPGCPARREPSILSEPDEAARAAGQTVLRSR